MTMTPTIGRIVHVFPGENAKHLYSNGQGANDPVPAIVTRVWDSHCINAYVIVDGPAPVWVTSIRDDPPEGNMRWAWPEIIQNVPPPADSTGRIR